ncbi:hypothetical protein BKA66DRAFT_444811 [Pyrenochaeta sp. MPI-SDFR-AT-0127]|nr:hypothetical protein BKA66DRAFT_444811 [Pyrenochaeta sp. MPI-SDFR-AT-0127]
MPPKAAPPTTTRSGRPARSTANYSRNYYEGPPVRPRRRRRAPATESGVKKVPIFQNSAAEDNGARIALAIGSFSYSVRTNGAKKKRTGHSRLGQGSRSKRAPNRRRSPPKAGRVNKSRKDRTQPAIAQASIMARGRACAACGQGGHIATNPICPQHPSRQE